MQRARQQSRRTNITPRLPPSYNTFDNPQRESDAKNPLDVAVCQDLEWGDGRHRRRTSCLTVTCAALWVIILLLAAAALMWMWVRDKRPQDTGWSMPWINE